MERRKLIENAVNTTRNAIEYNNDFKKALKNNRIIVENFDSVTHELGWGVNNSYIENFRATFNDCLPKEYQTQSDTDGFREYIEDTLSLGKGERTAVEFGGPGQNLFSGFTKGFFHRTVGVCLKDILLDGEREKGEASGHLVIEGNILDVINYEVYEKVEKKLKGKKTNLIISRMQGALDGTDTNPVVLDRIIRKWYSMLDSNGIIFVQFPLVGKKRTQDPVATVVKWVEVVEKRFPQIEIQIDTSGGAMRLHKRPGAPDELLPATQLFK